MDELMEVVITGASPPKRPNISKNGMAMARRVFDRQLAHAYDNSPMMHTVSIEEQARRRPSDFLGQCAYLRLDDPRSQKTIGGDYLIAYARSYPGRNDMTETFRPSRERLITVVTDIHSTRLGTATHEILARGYYAAVKMIFNGRVMYFGLRASRSHNPKTYADVIYRATELDAQKLKRDTSQLGPVLDRGVSGREENFAYYGIKNMESDLYKGDDMFFGFNFLELDMTCTHSDGLARQVIIAIKIDNDAEDVGSAYLLKQLVHMPVHEKQYFLQPEEDEDLQEEGGVCVLQKR